MTTLVKNSVISLTIEEVKILADYLDKMDKEHDGVPFSVQNIAEKFWYITYPGK